MGEAGVHHAGQHAHAPTMDISRHADVAYTNVAEIHRTLVIEKQGGRYSSALPQHWVKVDGLWLRDRHLATSRLGGLPSEADPFASRA